MNISLGNLTIEKIEKEYNVVFSNEDKEFLQQSRQERVDKPIGKNKWHCFDMPRLFVVGSEEFGKKLYERLKKYQFKGQIKIAVQEEEK